MAPGNTRNKFELYHLSSHIINKIHMGGNKQIMINNETIEAERTRVCLTIGRIAPDFTAVTTEGPITLSQYRGKWVLFFSHPGDFTPVPKDNYLKSTSMPSAKNLI